MPADASTPRLWSAATVGAVAVLVASAVLWAISLPAFDISRVNDLGLISLAPQTMLLGIGLIGVGFAIALRASTAGHVLAVAAILLVVLTVHALPSLVEDAPRGSVAYLH